MTFLVNWVSNFSVPCLFSGVYETEENIPILRSDSGSVPKLLEPPPSPSIVLNHLPVAFFCFPSFLLGRPSLGFRMKNCHIKVWRRRGFQFFLKVLTLKAKEQNILLPPEIQSPKHGHISIQNHSLLSFAVYRL